MFAYNNIMIIMKKVYGTRDCTIVVDGEIYLEITFSISTSLHIIIT
ncbi:hypothetical protein [Sporosalibacterium faouarense]|nr:hypothetical protein [Sporosalibacterium faouarense]